MSEANRPDPSQETCEGQTVSQADVPDPVQDEHGGQTTREVDKPGDELRHWKTRRTNENPEDVARARTRLADELTSNGRVRIRGLMCPRGRADQHPAAQMLRQYAKQGCLVSQTPSRKFK